MADSATTISTLEIKVQSSAESAISALDKLESKLTSVANILAKIQTSGNAFSGIVKAASALEKIASATNKANKAQKEMNNKKMSPTVNTADMEKMSSLLDEIKSKMRMSDFTGQKNPFGAVTADMEKQLPAIRKTYTDYMKFLPAVFEKQLPAVSRVVPRTMESVLEQVKSKMSMTDFLGEKNPFGEFGKSTDAFKEFAAYSDAIRTLSENIEDGTEKFTEPIKESAQIADAIDVEWKEIESSVSSATAAANEFKEASERGLFGSRHLARTGMKAADALGYKDIAKGESDVLKHFRSSPELEQFISSTRGTYGIGEKIGVKATVGLKEMTRVHKEAEEAAKKQADAEKEVGKEAEKAGSGIGSIGREASNSGRRATSIFSALKDSLKGVAGLFKKFGQAVGKVLGGGGGHKGLLGNRSLGQFIGLIVLRRLITSALRALVSGIKEGSDNLTQYSASYNNAISKITSALGVLKNAWAVAFAPIVEAVAPMLVKFINMIIAALNAIGRLMAALTGKGFAVQAVDFFEDYAKGLDKTGSSAGGAKKALDEYKKTILSFDELHVLNDQNANASGGGGGGGGGGGSTTPISDMFTTVEVDSTSLAGAINKALENIDWTSIQKKAKEVAKKIADSINKFVAELDWHLLGETLGNGIQTAFLFANTLLDETDWEGIGTAIGEFVNGLNEKFRLEELGKFVAKGFNAIADVINNFALTVEWDEVGKNIREGLEGFVKEFDADKVGGAIENFLDGIDTMLNEATKDPKVFEEFGAKLGTALSKVSWGTHLKTVANAIWIAIKNALRGFVSTEAGSFITTIAALLTVTKLAPLGDAVVKIFLGAKFKKGVADAIAAAVNGGVSSSASGAAAGTAGLGVGGTLAVSIVAASIATAIAKGIEVYNDSQKYEHGTQAQKRQLEEKYETENKYLWMAGNDGIAPYSSEAYRETYPWAKDALEDATEKINKSMANKLLSVWSSGGKIKSAPSGGGAGMTQKYRSNVSVAMNPRSTKNAMLYRSTLENGKATSTVSVKTDPGFVDTSKTYISLKNKSATVTAYGKSSSSFTGLESSFSGGVWTKFNSAVKTIFGSTDKTYTQTADKFSAFVDGKAKKTITGGTDKTFNETKSKFDWFGYKSDKKTGLFTALKTITGKTADSFKNTKDKFEKVPTEKTSNLKATGTDGGGLETTYNRVMGIAAANGKSYAISMHGNWNVDSVTASTAAQLQFRGYFSGMTPMKNANGGIYLGGMWKDITKYAMGGYPNESGQLFIAREAGPELVGTIGGHTAVLNNNQIVASVAAGVYNAVVQAMSNVQGNQTIYVESVLKTDNETLARAVNRGNASLKYRGAI